MSASELNKTGTLSLLFPELSLSPNKGDFAPVLRKFERMAGDPDSPIRAIRRTPARPAEYADFPDDLDPGLREVLGRRGIERLYTHQAEACRQIGGGSNAVIVTPTASGKTLCYNLPVLNRLICRPGRPRDVPVPHQGTGRGSTRRTARPHRSNAAPTCAPSLTMAILRRTRGAPSGSAPTSS